MRNLKKKFVNTVSIRLSSSDSDSRCCFDVLVDGLQLTSSLTFGELLEYLITIYRDFIFGNTYSDDYPKILIRYDDNVSY